MAAIMLDAAAFTIKPGFPKAIGSEITSPGKLVVVSSGESVVASVNEPVMKLSAGNSVVYL